MLCFDISCKLLLSCAVVFSALMKEGSFLVRLHNKQRIFTLASRLSPGLQRDIHISTLTITFGGSRGRSTDMMRRPRVKIGGRRAHWCAHTMACAVSIYLPFTCPRALHESPLNDVGTREAPPAEHLTLCRVSVWTSEGTGSLPPF